MLLVLCLQPKYWQMCFMLRLLLQKVNIDYNLLNNHTIFPGAVCLQLPLMELTSVA